MQPVRSGPACLELVDLNHDFLLPAQTPPRAGRIVLGLESAASPRVFCHPHMGRQEIISEKRRDRRPPPATITLEGDLYDRVLGQVIVPAVDISLVA